MTTTLNSHLPRLLCAKAALLSLGGDAHAQAVATGVPPKAIWGESPLAEPYPYVTAGGLTGDKVAESCDPLVAYRWAKPQAADGLEIYLIKSTIISATPSSALTNLESLTGKAVDVTVASPGSIRLDFGLEHAAWVEFDSPDCPSDVEMSISEYDELAPGKTRSPVKHGNTYRLELNDGVRFAWIKVKSAVWP